METLVDATGAAGRLAAAAGVEPGAARGEPGAAPPGMSTAEWRVRCDLAALYRVVAL